MLEEYITEKEVAKMLGVSVKAVQNWRSKKLNLSYAKMGKNIRYLRTEVNAFSAKQLVPLTKEVVIKRKGTVINIAKMPIEELIALPADRLTELEQETDEVIREAKSLKSWISGIKAIRDASDNSNHANDNKQQINYGGQNEQATNY
jgi:hypothetical protein